MTERMKDLAKQFFLLLHVFLERRYKRVDLVFIRHAEVAEEVDEDTFFHDPRTGGTVVSSALIELLRVTVRALPVRRLEHLRGAGLGRPDNSGSDTPKSCALLQGQILPLVQYYAYIEIVGLRCGDPRRDPTSGAATAPSPRPQRAPDDAPGRRQEGHLPRCFRDLFAPEAGGRMSPLDVAGGRAARRAATRPALQRLGLGLRHPAPGPTTRSSASPSTSSSSKSTPTASRSSRPSRCSTSTPRTACR